MSHCIFQDGKYDYISLFDIEIVYDNTLTNYFLSKFYIYNVIKLLTWHLKRRLLILQKNWF